MTYLLKIFSADDVTDAERAVAVERFRAALEETLGDASLVLPCYHAYQKLFQQYADHPRPWPITPAEQLLAEQWEAAELAATHAAFGVNRYLGDADFEIQPSPRLHGTAFSH
jgi:non-ribosomal peptide synthetase component F